LEAEAAGYAHWSYAKALSEFGTPRKLPRCGGWILERPLPGSNAVDAMGCYPLFACSDWSALGGDLDALRGDLVSLALVADPFGDYTPEQLHAWFDVVKPFKEHVVIDLSQPCDAVVSKHHQRNARRALRRLRIERCESPADHIDDWVALYSCLVERHTISGIPTFSRDSFSVQLEVPGGTLFRAIHDGRTVGAALRYQSGDVVYAHLVAFDDVGYRLGASYALTWFQLNYFADKARWFDLGGTPGVKAYRDSGLWHYKRGWSPETRPVYFCGRVLDRDRYDAIVKSTRVSTNGYFPAYRAGEFG
jgi:hypothetical protein